jgi:hypothetical protein
MTEIETEKILKKQKCPDGEVMVSRFIEVASSNADISAPSIGLTTIPKKQKTKKQKNKKTKQKNLK